MKRKKTSIYIREDLMEFAKAEAAKDCRSLNNYFEALLAKQKGEKDDRA